MNIIRRSLIVMSMAAVCVLSLPSLHASTVNVASPLHAFFGKAKTIQLSLRNDTGMAIELMAGTEVMKLDAGKTMSVKLPEGTRILANTETGKHKVGDVLVEVTSSISGATVAIG